MQIDLLGWSSRGLRCPDVTVDLRVNGKVPSVSLVQMPNGTGKTTTLELLKATLSGAAAGWNAEQIRELRRDGDTHPTGVFAVTLRLGGSIATWELTLDFEEGVARYVTSLPGSGGMQSRYERPPGLQDFLTPEFINLFVFDGELASDLLNPGKAAAEAAIDALCQLYLLRDVSAFTHDYWEQESKRQSSKTQTGLSRWLDMKKDIQSRQAVLTKGRDEAMARIAQRVKEAEDLEKKINARMAEVASTRAAHEAALSDLGKASAEVRGASTDLMAALRLPHALHPVIGERLTALRANLDILKLPESASAQFFRELLQQSDCICGRPLDHDARACLEVRAQEVLDSDESSVLNELKLHVDRFIVDADPESGHARVVELSERLRKATRDERDADTRVRALRQQLIDDGDEELEAWQKAFDGATEDIGKCEALVKEISGPGDWQADVGKIKSLSALQKKLSDAETRIAEITKTVSLKQDTEVIMAILERASAIAQEQIKADLIEKTNTRLLNVLKNDPLRVERIDKSLRLQGQKRGSRGQSLAVGYTFLLSALNRGANDFPLVVDSPALPMDSGVRRRTAQLLPELCTQFVGFTLNVEKAGFVDGLEASGADIDYLTIFRKTAGTASLMQNLPKAGVQETHNAVTVRDRDYFHQFDRDVEDEEANDVVQAAE